MIRLITRRRLDLLRRTARHHQAEADRLRGRLALLSRTDRGALLLALADQVKDLQHQVERADVPIGITPEDWAAALTYARSLRADAEPVPPTEADVPARTPVGDRSVGLAAATHWLASRPGRRT